MSKTEDDQLNQCMQSTILHYETRPQAFWEGTRDHDVSQNIDALSRHLPLSMHKRRVLDFGCGPGRDLKTLTDLGHMVVGLDGCASFCEMARQYSGCEVLHQNFVSLDLSDRCFHGIFANASLFHIHKSRLQAVLSTFYTVLVHAGVVFCSNPRGPNVEQQNGLRYGNYMDVEGWSQAFTQAGFTLVEHYFRPTGVPREEQPWLAMVWKK